MNIHRPATTIAEEIARRMKNREARRLPPTHAQSFLRSIVVRFTCRNGAVYCDKCDAEVAPGTGMPLTDPWGGVHGYWCKSCTDNYDGPGDEYYSGFYGGGWPTQREEYEAAAAEKRKLG